MQRITLTQTQYVNLILPRLRNVIDAFLGGEITTNEFHSACDYLINLEYAITILK